MSRDAGACLTAMRTRALSRVVAVAAPVLGMLVAACGSGTHTHPAGSQSQSRAGSAEEVSFLRKCSESVGVGGLGDAAVCQCVVTRLEAHANAHAFEVAVAAWEDKPGGARDSSPVTQTISRCNDRPKISSSSQSVPASVAETGSSARAIKLSQKRYARRFRWPTNARSMVHSCLDGGAVANGMSCTLAHAIDQAFGQYPGAKTALVRELHLIDPDNGRVVAVNCGISGRQGAGAVCNAPRHQVALLPPAGYAS